MGNVIPAMPAVQAHDLGVAPIKYEHRLHDR